MERLVKITLYFIMIAFFVSCENKWPHDGELGGMWQLMKVEKDGAVSDVKELKSYWSFRNGLLQFTNTKDNADGFIYERAYSVFSRQGNTIVLTDFCTNSMNLTEDDNNEWVSIEEKDIFYKYGIFAVEDERDKDKITTTFEILLLENDKLILESDSAILSFRKF